MRKLSRYHPHRKWHYIERVVCILVAHACLMLEVIGCSTEISGPRDSGNETWWVMRWLCNRTAIHYMWTYAAVHYMLEWSVVTIPRWGLSWTNQWKRRHCAKNWGSFRDIFRFVQTFYCMCSYTKNTWKWNEYYSYYHIIILTWYLQSSNSFTFQTLFMYLFKILKSWN